MENLLVSILDGKVIGANATSAFSGKKYFKFCGIPYAKPPVGSLRFQPPQPVERWSGILDAKKEKNDCIQYSLFAHKIIGSEDCLYLNVYCPEIPREITKPKAVIIQIHQGGHYWGSSSKKCFGNPDFFIDQDIIFVSFNFRLHILGFMNLNIPQCTGNMGLKDQNLALKWVKENIAYFGGDPNNITLYGNSSGASDIHLHMLSPMSKDLFKRAVLQNGYALSPPWSYQEDTVNRSFRLARMLGFKGTSTVGLLRYMKRQDPVKLVQACVDLRKELQIENPGRSEMGMYQPTVEIFEEAAFLYKSPRELLNNMQPKPLICSVTSDEGLIAFYVDVIPLLNNQLADVIRGNLWMYNLDEDIVQYICKEIRAFYFDNKTIDYSMLREVIDLYTDLWYCEWNDWLNMITSNSAEAPVYAYYFAYEGNLSLTHSYFVKHLEAQRGSVKTRASHGDDSAYFSLFLTGKNEKLPLKISDDDRKVISYVTHMITNFAKNGDPNGEELGNIRWIPFCYDNPSYLSVNGGLEITQGRIFEARYNFWQNLMKRIKRREVELENCDHNGLETSIN